MDNQTTQQVFNYIDALAQKLGVASEFVFKVLIKQQYVSGVLGIISFMALLTLFIIILFKLTPFVIKRTNEKIEKDNIVKKHYPEGWIDYPQIVLPGIAVIAILTIAVLVGFFTVLPDSIGKLINPQYYAIKELLDTIKGG